MLKLQTTVDVPPAEKPLGLHTPITLLGSCFAQHIRQRLEDYKFQVGGASTGVIFNPQSIASLVKWGLGQESWADPRQIAVKDGVFRHFNLHSHLYGLTEEDLREQMSALQHELKQQLEAAQLLVITLGTAWVYEHIEMRRTVANCHKAPATHFQKRMLSLAEITEALQEIKALLPHAEILLTVSPVRHIKDTLPLNAASKASLRLACHQLQSASGFGYFPSYEIMMDELRDYRFYEADLIHPNQQAIEHIWTKFVASHLTAEAQQWVSTWGKVRQSLQHRPLVPCTAAHLQFLGNLRGKLLRLSETADVSLELREVEGRLAACQP